MSSIKLGFFHESPSDVSREDRTPHSCIIRYCLTKKVDENAVFPSGCPPDPGFHVPG
jgi:hypothetical protein